MKYDSKFLQLDARLFGERAADSEKDIRVLENSLEFRFPEAYRELVARYGGAILFGKGASYQPLEPSPFADDEGRQDIDMLYGPGDGEFGLSRVNQRLRDQLPPHVLAIGNECFGDKICLGIVGPDRGRVFYWYHEDPDELRIYLIANSFDEFIEMLEPEPGFNDPIESDR